MIINENLFNGQNNFLDNQYRNYYNSEIVNIEDGTIYAKNDDRALFYININAPGVKNDTITISAQIQNKGEVPFELQLTGTGNSLYQNILPSNGVYVLNHTTTIRDPVIAFRFSCREKGLLGIDCRNIKIEQGDKATPYLPHKDNLPEDKQPLLPPEGDYKEIQAR